MLLTDCKLFNVLQSLLWSNTGVVRLRFFTEGSVTQIRLSVSSITGSADKVVSIEPLQNLVS